MTENECKTPKGWQKMNVRHPMDDRKCKAPNRCLTFIFYQKYFLW